MIKTGKCPKCGKVPWPNIIIQGIEMKAPGGNGFNGVMYVCPNGQCNNILGVGIDPVALKTDTVNEVVLKLKASR